MANPPPNFNPSPKTRFIQVEANVKAHHALIERSDLDRSLDVALQQYQLLLVLDAKDANAAAAAHFKITGVLEFLHQFKYLAEAVAPNKTNKPTGLDYNA
jgi:hypothetical protein